MNKRVTERIVCALLSAALMLGLFSSCKKTGQTGTEGTTAAPEETTAPQVRYTDAPGSVKKSETVYVNLDKSGKPASIVVSDWLHTDKACVRVDDKSDSKNIVNVKGLETPERNGEDLIWHMSSTDLYYRGFSDKQLPVEIALSYTLDGKEISPEELPGKSGDLKIDIALQNNVSREVEIDGVKETIYCPFIVIGGALYPDSTFSGVSVEGGRVLSDGAKQAALFVSVPGMRASLGLDEMSVSDLYGFSFPDGFSVSAHVTNCNIGNMYFAVLPLSALGYGNVITEDMAELEKTLKQLTETINSVYEMNIGRILGILTGNSDNITSLIDAVRDAAGLYNENKQLLAALSEFITPENANAVSALIEDLKGVDLVSVASVLTDPSVKALIDNVNGTDLSKYKELISNPLFGALFSDLSGILQNANEALPALEKFTQSLSDGSMQKLMDDLNALLPAFQGLGAKMEEPEVKACVDRLPETVTKLAAIIDKISQNKELIDALSQLATEENIDKISHLMNGFDADDAAVLFGIADVTAELAAKLLPRVKSFLELGRSYTVFSEAPENMATAVMFVYQTPGF
ncbi:MAG: hypothetical protein IJL26_11120 [Clostridia bacterium]|nr:hypothetical protein [Clostridia bacterium]